MTVLDMMGPNMEEEDLEESENMMGHARIDGHVGI